MVGAGIAGLTPRPSSPRAGTDVAVLEARDRVGGRTWNTEIGGEANELGGQWVAPYQSAMHASARGPGDRAVPELPRGRAHLRRPGPASPIATTGTTRRSARASESAFEDADAKLDSLAKELDPEAPWEHPDAAALDQITFESWLQRGGLRRDGARPDALLAGRRLPGEAGAHLLAAAGPVDDLRRRRHLRAVRARAVPRLPRRRRLAADRPAACRAARRSRRAGGARARGSLVRAGRRGRGRRTSGPGSRPAARSSRSPPT